MERIVFLERNTIQADFRRPNFDHEWIEYPETADEQVVERVRDATVIISNKLSLGEPQLSNAPKVRLIAIAATGSDCVDLSYCRARGIAVCNVRGYALNTVAEHVLMLMLALRRNLLAYRADVQRGLWNESKQFCLLTHELHDIRNSTLGIIGYGSIGRSTAGLGESLGMRVLISEHKHATTIRAGRAAFEDTLAQSDVLSLHCPLTEETRNLIGAAELQMMKRNALLINTARGALIDDEALIDALNNGVIAAAGLDVLREEPPRNGSPLLDLNLPNLIITPHVAWASRDAVQILADQVIDNIEGFVSGKPKNLLT
ncbi:MAG TPA: D-2-hydroxyacid dehydrogenase [Pyrinomonadaceae bacterium]|jgi:glycerate dehydrogenase|nr:D-2-hydroxyacid dehydrogenase [Pyrinomonadaceae bacterium]